MVYSSTLPSFMKLTIFFLWTASLTLARRSSYSLKQEPFDEATISNSTNATEANITLSPMEEARNNFDAFNAGFKGDEFASNFTDCGQRSILWWFLEYPTYKVKMEYADGGESVYNTTHFLQNFS